MALAIGVTLLPAATVSGLKRLSGAVAACRAAKSAAQGELQRAQSTYARAHSAHEPLKQTAESRAGLITQPKAGPSRRG